MIIYSITYAVEDKCEQDWLSFMREVFIPSVMDSGYFEEYTFTRVLPQEGVDTAYNIQYRCFNTEKLNLFITKEQAEIDEVLFRKFSGKIACFHTKLEELI